MTEVGRFTMWVILLVIAIIGAHFLVLSVESPSRIPTFAESTMFTLCVMPCVWGSGHIDHTRPVRDADFRRHSKRCLRIFRAISGSSCSISFYSSTRSTAAISSASPGV